MKVIIDNKIPFIHQAIEQIADEVVYASGKDFTPDLVKDADALIIRTRTHCDCNLLKNSRVQFIATATIGFDHIDTDFCQEAGITWCNAPGCNSASVAQYVQAALLLLAKTRNIELKGLTLGVIGVGNVGKKVAELGKRLGMNVLLNDPPRASQEDKVQFSSLETLASACDIISFHVPLIREDKYCTYHLANEAFFASLKKRPVIINTSRGEVIDTQALLKAMNSQLIQDAIIDVWENEPYISLDLLNKAFLGTPHIAGYSADGKANATQMALDALCNHFHLNRSYSIVPPQPTVTAITTSDPTEAVLQMYNPALDSLRLKENPACFEQLRGDYPLRRESKAYTFTEALPYSLF